MTTISTPEEVLAMPETKECTLMFYFASDNPLAISAISQLKAIKAGGYHQDANVIVQFDPFTEGTPTHVFDVNLINKLKTGKNNIGFDGDEPFVRNLIEDKLWRNETSRNERLIKDEIRDALRASHPNSREYNPPEPPPDRADADGNGLTEELSPERSLGGFLEFCAREYPANHYMLFILGHGVIVGNDVFLFDENAEEHSMTLGVLGNTLRSFKEQIGQNASFDLVGFHSCSVSSVEVAYELIGTANYMLASQGTAFVGSWPYRQILIRVFEDLARHAHLNAPDVREMLVKVFFYCLHNSTDFLLAGYPFDLSLTDLTKVPDLHQPMEQLSTALINALPDPHCNNLIVLAHWKAQSFYQEMYTDLYDFCFCLREKIDELPKPLGKKQQDMLNACTNVIDALEKGSPATSGRPNNAQQERMIVCSEQAGPEYQYSHGLSVYFPWSKPSEDRRILEEYAQYKITTAFAPSATWLRFLKEYFDKTKRKPRKEQNPVKVQLNPEQALLEDEITLVYKQGGPRNGENALERSKTDPKDPTGGDCDCPSIKNYPQDTRDRRVRRKVAVGSLPLSDNFFTAS